MKQELHPTNASAESLAAAIDSAVAFSIGAKPIVSGIISGTALGAVTRLAQPTSLLHHPIVAVVFWSIGILLVGCAYASIGTSCFMAGHQFAKKAPSAGWRFTATLLTLAVATCLLLLDREGLISSSRSGSVFGATTMSDGMSTLVAAALSLPVIASVATRSYLLGAELGRKTAEEETAELFCSLAEAPEAYWTFVENHAAHQHAVARQQLAKEKLSRQLDRQNSKLTALKSQKVDVPSRPRFGDLEELKISKREFDLAWTDFRGQFRRLVKRLRISNRAALSGFKSGDARLPLFSMEFTEKK